MNILFKIVKILSKGIVKFTIEVDPDKLMMRGKIINVCKVKILCLINKFVSADQNKKQIEREILKINKLQYRYFDKVIGNYIKVANIPGLERYWDNMMKIIESFCRNVEKIVIANESGFECCIKNILREM